MNVPGRRIVQFRLLDERRSYCIVHRDLIDISPPLQAILDRLIAAGGRLMIVGGVVRDALLGVDCKDSDVECYALDYGGVADALAGLGRADVVGAAFGVLKCEPDGLDVEISLPQLPSKVASGHRGFDIEVDHALSFAETSSRRTSRSTRSAGIRCRANFTTLTAARTISRRGCSVTSAMPSRMIRCRCSAASSSPALRYGPAPDTAKLCRSLVDHFEQLSIERVWEVVPGSVEVRW